MATPNLPDNDTDLKLARAFGSFLAGKNASPLADDPVLSHLQRYEEFRTRKGSRFSIDSKTLWNSINEQTAPDQSSRLIPIWSATSRTVAAAAAAVLIAAMLGIFFYINRQPELVASSQASIETITLADGSTVTLRPYSTLHKRATGADKRSYSLRGEAFFNVTADPERIFSVRTGSGKVSVLGTRFNLSTWGSKTQLFLEEGSVRFKNLASDRAVILKPGQSATIAAGNPLVAADSAGGNEFTDWMNRELVFKKRTARYVFSELEQHFDIRIIAPESVSGVLVGGRLSLADQSRSLNDLALVLDGTFKQTKSDTYRFIPN